jgi:hypothetical protein
MLGPGLYPIFDPVRRWSLRSVPGLVSWLRSDQLVTLASGKVSTWGDLSGRGNGVAQASEVLRPTYRANGGPGDLPYLDCAVVSTQASELLWTAGAFAALTAAECFFVYQNNADPPADSGSNKHGGIYQFGSATGEFAPYHDGTFYESFFCAARHDGTFSLATGATASAPVVYNVSSQSNAFTSRVNGAAKYTTATNTFSAAGIMRLLVNSQSYFLFGKAFEFALFSRVLTVAERARVTNYLKTRYGIS